MVIILYYFNIFFIFSILGHFIENIVYTKVDSGILYGLWTPIYGIGTITIILIYKYIKKFKINKFVNAILLFVFSSLILGIIETLGGYYIEFFFGRIFWNYKNHFIPIGKYTSLQMMFLWGFSSIVLIYLIMPIVNKFIYKIPNYFTSLFIFTFFLDLFYTYTRLSIFI